MRATLRETERLLDHKTMLTGLLGAIVVALTLLFGALHLWPPHP